MNRRTLTTVAACLLGLTVLASSEARGSDRFALIIGANSGDADEPPLRFAERDAQRMAEILGRLGNVPAENTLVLLGPERDDVDRALTALRARIAAHEGQGPPLVLFYYSGHADAQALHLSGTRMPFGELKRQVKELGGELAVLILDACRSGGLIRAKGAQPAAPFEIHVEDALRSRGVAIITSSSESEDAQESERLGGGVFTHHLLTGLAGAADFSRDGRVDLSEAYRYAHAQTIASTSTTRVVQHPTFAFDLEGEREVVLTRVDQQRGLGRLRLPEGGHYLIFERAGAGELAAELHATAGTELLLPPGPYLVRRRDPATVWEKKTTVAANTLSAPTEFARVPYRHAVRKGYGQQERRAVSIGADLEAMGPVLPETDWSVLGAVGMQFDFAEVALKARVRFGQGIADSGPLALRQRYLGLDLGLYHIFDLGQHGLGFGIRGGLDWISQRFTTAGVAPPRDQVLGRLGPALRFELALSPTVALTFDAGADGYFAEVLTPQGDTETRLRVAPVFTMGFGVLLP